MCYLSCEHLPPMSRLACYNKCDRRHSACLGYTAQLGMQRAATMSDPQSYGGCYPPGCQVIYDTCAAMCGRAGCLAQCADDYHTCMLPCNTGTAQRGMQRAATFAQQRNGWRSATQEQDSTERQSYGGCGRYTGYPFQQVDRRPCSGSKPGPKPLPQDYLRSLSRSYFDVWN
jgi:hypothetical protein